MTTDDRSLYARTIASGGGTFELHAENFERRDITSGYAVGLVSYTYARSFVPNGDPLEVERSRKIFNYGIANILKRHNDADAIGTWVNGEAIHIDPVRIFATFADALTFAIEMHQIAFYHLDTSTEYTVADYVKGNN